MKIGAFVPVKAYSERVCGKNFRALGNKPLFRYILEAAMQSESFDDIFVDSNSNVVREFCKKNALGYIEREEWLASNQANGNDLLIHHAKVKPDYDYYFQLFATAPFLTAKTIRYCVSQLMLTNEHDSVFTATKDNGFYWFQNQPLNYQPGVLPRSQDLVPVLQETTGLYGIKRQSLLRYHCRIGAKPLIVLVSRREAVDINVEEDFEYAEWCLSLNGSDGRHSKIAISNR
jgi:N-acylneuraminate cytidylyltransferase